MLFNTGIELAKRQQLAGRFLLLLVVRLEKRLDRLLHRLEGFFSEDVERAAGGEMALDVKCFGQRRERTRIVGLIPTI
jgi:hypothetical protein